MGDNFEENRVRNLGHYDKTLTDYKLVTERKLWVSRIKGNTSEGTLSSAKVEDVLAWAATFKMSAKALNDRILQYVRDRQPGPLKIGTHSHFSKPARGRKRKS